MQQIERGAVMLPIARGAIAQALGRVAQAREDAAWLHERGATFVTLTQHGALRGCIGSLQAQRRLIDDLKTNAAAAALRDPRFTPLAPRELDAVRISVSLLSPMQAMVVSGEADALAQLRVGIDGLVFECAGRRSTFLPQVWEQLTTPRDFLRQLKAKAGLTPDFWSVEVRLHRYTVAKWEEQQDAHAMATDAAPATGEQA